MIIMRKINLLLLLLILSSGKLFSLDINRKFGKVSKEELLMKVYEKDSSAEALILFDIGNTKFEYQQDKGFVMEYERHLRLKIFSKDGFGYANFNIDLYNNNGNKEKISSIKAVTYNIEDEKIVKTKLNKSEIFYIEETPRKTISKFTLPQVKENSVIEVTYTIRSDFFYNLQSWNFQHFIPALWSEYWVEIPEYFRYNKIAKGYLPFEINTTNKDSDFITINTKTRTGGFSGPVKTNFESQKIDFKKVIFHFAVKDAPAMKKEAYMLSSKNYLSSIEFELAQIQFPNSQIKNYSSTWESINKELLNHSNFGDQLNNGRYLSEVIENIVSKTQDSKEQISLIHDYIKNNYKWNEYNSIYTSKNLRKTFNEKTGNSADLNLLLVLMLREAGFKADPVILSTRNHGILNMVHPSVSQMNYVVALVNFEGNNIFIDVTDPYCLPGMLPPRCINDKGRIISNQNSKWININPTNKYQTTYFGNFVINDNEIKGSVVGKHEGFASYQYRRKYDSFNNEEEFISSIESNNPGINIEEYQFDNIDNIDKPVQNKFTDFVIESFDNFGNTIYFNPISIDRIEENPFKLDERKYPIDYNYLYNQKYIFSYVIPEGYTVDEIPKSEQFSMPENGAKYKYLISTNKNQIQITIQFDINKRQFLPDDYQYLKEFYNLIIAKEKEQIVLKKI